MSKNKKLTIEHFLTQCECNVITLKCVILIFLTVENQTFHYLCKFAKQT